MVNKIKGTLYGQALGDAMGMPGELWNRNKIQRELGSISTFLNGPKNNLVASNYTAGQFTDDTSQALVILDSLKQTNYKPDGKIIALNMLKWAEANNAFEQNILGPTSKLALNLVKEGKDTNKVAKEALSNGAAMRIAPIGCLFNYNELYRLADYIRDISKETHFSDISIAGAVMIAASVTLAMEYSDVPKAIVEAIQIEEYALSLGEETFSASIKSRVEYGINFINSHINDEEKILQFIYKVIGCGVLTSESVSSALLMAYYTKNPNKCALLCANIGGDTDTIGAMATAICGAAYGIESFDREYIETINKNNNINMEEYIDIIKTGRKTLHD
ncbi:MAG: ADP-ribosylglycohydrolase family protein [Brevinema sp.]